jgi:hypothetical protein
MMSWIRAGASPSLAVQVGRGRLGGGREPAGFLVLCHLGLCVGSYHQNKPSYSLKMPTVYHACTKDCSNVTLIISTALCSPNKSLAIVRTFRDTNKGEEREVPYNFSIHHYRLECTVLAFYISVPPLLSLQLISQSPR